MALSRLGSTASLLLVASACSSPSCPASIVGTPRDFNVAPAIVDRPTFTRLVALSDIHGGYDRMVALLARHGLVAATPTTADAAQWTGGDTTLVIVGDLIDKGAQSVEVVDFVRALETSASVAGGHVVTTLGNHEAEFLANPYNDKAGAFDNELRSSRLDPCVIATTDPRGVWLRSRPFGARIGDWFFAHAGDSHGRTLGELEQALRAGVTANDFRDVEVIGAGSLLEARDWWQASAGIAQRDANALGVGHIVFGHAPSALGSRGSIATGEGGVLFRIDTGMSPAVNDSEGALLQITHEASDEVATELRADGSMHPLWRGPQR